MIEPSATSVINDRYALRELIASGGMASVYLADDLRLQRQVAVKVLTADDTERAEAVERFRREAMAAASLSHPNVVAVYDWGRHEDTAFLVMEYVDGPDLRTLVRERGPLPEDLALRLAAQIAAALEVAHARGIVHRDVKPRNVLLDRDGNAKLADFGIAASDSDEDGVVYGTALYVSPEQASGQQVDARSDLYSLGVLLYELLTGQPPFTAGSPAEIAARHVHDPVVPPRRLRRDLSSAVEQVVLRLLEKSPARRFASARELRDALHSVTTGSDASRDGWAASGDGTAPLSLGSSDASAPRSDGSRDASSVNLPGGNAGAGAGGIAAGGIAAGGVAAGGRAARGGPNDAGDSSNASGPRVSSDYSGGSDHSGSSDHSGTSTVSPASSVRPARDPTSPASGPSSPPSRAETAPPPSVTRPSDATAQRGRDARDASAAEHAVAARSDGSGDASSVELAVTPSVTRRGDGSRDASSVGRGVPGSVTRRRDGSRDAFAPRRDGSRDASFVKLQAWLTRRGAGALIAVLAGVLLLAAVAVRAGAFGSGFPGFGGGFGLDLGNIAVGAASTPDLGGMPLETARQTASAAGLSLEVEEQATTETPAGIVVSQERRGSTIHAIVSRGISVPDIMGQQCPKARADLQRAGWSVRPVRWRFANIEDFGKIVAQEPAAGQVVPRAGEITVQVAGPVAPC